MRTSHKPATPRPPRYTAGVSTPHRRRIAVVGAGISGLAAAHRLNELSQLSDVPVDVTLYEASDRCGGVFGTEVVDDYRLELGADMFITDKPWGVDLCRRLGLVDQLISPDPRYRQSLILCRGRPVPTPDAFNLMAPGRWWPILTTPLLSPWGKLRLLCEPFIREPRADDPDADESLAAFVRRRLGREALDRIVQPLVGGIYTGDPERLSLLATLPRFRHMVRQYGSLTRAQWRQRRERSRPAEDRGGVSGARYGLFVSLRDGMGSLTQTLSQRLAGAITWRTASPVLGIECTSREQRHPVDNNPKPGGRVAGSPFRVVTAADAHNFDGVILALPAHQAAALVTSSRPELAAALKEIEYASSVVVVTGHRLADVAHPLRAYGLVVPHREGRRILAVSFLSRKFPDRAPPDCVVLRTFVGGALQPELTALDDPELVRLVRDELRDVLGVRGEPTVCRVVRYRRAMPQYHVGHLERVRRIESLQRQTPGLELCGNAYRGVGLPDCIHDGEAAAERLLGELAAAADPASLLKQTL